MAVPKKRGRKPTRIKDPAQYDAIREAAAAGRGKNVIAREIVGCTPGTFRKILEHDQQAADALKEGQDDRWESILQAVGDTAKDRTSPKQVAAAQLFARLTGKDTSTEGPTVNISLPGPMKQADFLDMVKPPPQAPDTLTIEHKPDPATASIADILNRRPK